MTGLWEIEQYFANGEKERFIRLTFNILLKLSYRLRGERKLNMSEIKFGKRIREVRENAGYNQKEFGSLLNIKQSTLSAYETDRMQPTISALVKIAEMFDVSLDWLCGIVKEEQDKKLELNDCTEILTDLAKAKDVFAALEKANAEAKRFFEELLKRDKSL